MILFTLIRFTNLKCALLSSIVTLVLKPLIFSGNYLMAESEFNEDLVKHERSGGGDRDMGYMLGETISYNGVVLIEHEDSANSTADMH